MKCIDIVENVQLRLKVDINVVPFKSYFCRKGDTRANASIPPLGVIKRVQNHANKRAPGAMKTKIVNAVCGESLSS